MPVRQEIPLMGQRLLKTAWNGVDRGVEFTEVTVSKAEEKDATNCDKGSAWSPEPEAKKRMLEGTAGAAVDPG